METFKTWKYNKIQVRTISHRRSFLSALFDFHREIPILLKPS